MYNETTQIARSILFESKTFTPLMSARNEQEVYRSHTSLETVFDQVWIIINN